MIISIDHDHRLVQLKTKRRGKIQVYANLHLCFDVLKRELPL